MLHTGGYGEIENCTFVAPAREGGGSAKVAHFVAPAREGREGVWEIDNVGGSLIGNGFGISATSAFFCTLDHFI